MICRRRRDAAASRSISPRSEVITAAPRRTATSTPVASAVAPGPVRCSTPARFARSASSDSTEQPSRSRLSAGCLAPRHASTKHAAGTTASTAAGFTAAAGSAAAACRGCEGHTRRQHAGGALIEYAAHLNGCACSNCSVPRGVVVHWPVNVKVAPAKQGAEMATAQAIMPKMFFMTKDSSLCTGRRRTARISVREVLTGPNQRWGVP